MTAAALPPALERWHAWLGWFDAELAALVGDLVMRLADLVGPAHALASRAPQEPDGLDDLRARGPYERLLASEWLLAQELPDEFLRRAAAAEHLFLAPRLRSPRIERRVVAIFDCGPRQLGAPRLAHVAAWILLARRATDLGGTLRWGVLQAPGELHGAESVAALNALLAARRVEVARPEQVEAWRSRLAQDAAGTHAETETWWIGAGRPASVEPAARGERVLALDTVFAGDALAAELAAGGRLRRVALPLPAGPAAARLLRGRFRDTPMPTPAQRVPRAQRLSIAKAPVMSVPPGHVAVPTVDGNALLVFHVCDKPTRKVARQRLAEMPSSRPPMAATLLYRQPAALCGAGASFNFWPMTHYGGQFSAPRDVFEPSIATANWLPMAYLKSNSGQRICVVDRANRLVSWLPQPTLSRNPVDPGPRVIDKGILAMAQVDGESLIFAVEYGGGLWLRELRAVGEPKAFGARLCAMPEPGARAVLAVRAGGRRGGRAVAVAVREGQRSNAWLVHSRIDPKLAIDAPANATSRRLELGRDEHVHGVVHFDDDGETALVVRAADGRSLRLATPEGSKTLHASPSRIDQVAVCPLSGRVALVAGGDLLVLDSALRVALLATRAEAPEGGQ